MLQGARLDLVHTSLSEELVEQACLRGSLAWHGFMGCLALLRWRGSHGHKRGADCGGKPCSAEHSAHCADKKQGNCPGFTGRCTRPRLEWDKEKGIRPSCGLRDGI